MGQETPEIRVQRTTHVYLFRRKSQRMEHQKRTRLLRTQTYCASTKPNLQKSQNSIFEINTHKYSFLFIYLFIAYYDLNLHNNTPLVA